MWFHFRQNNSGGYFRKPAIHIFVEADTAEQANEVAASIEGVYFHGVSSGIDCDCCGDRWRPVFIETESTSDGYETLEAAISGNYFPRYAISGNYFPRYSDHERAEKEGTTLLKIVFQ